VKVLLYIGSMPSRARMEVTVRMDSSVTANTFCFTEVRSSLIEASTKFGYRWAGSVIPPIKPLLYKGLQQLTALPEQEYKLLSSLTTRV